MSGADKCTRKSGAINAAIPSENGQLGKPRLEHFCLHGGGREAAHQPEPDLRAVIEAAHVGDEGVDQITEAARGGRTAIEARQRVLEPVGMRETLNWRAFCRRAQSTPPPAMTCKGRQNG
jgi:hypothetical protein